MKIAVMQPYLFPYIGYFQLIGAVEKFIIFDNVNFINKGWINRNCVLLDGKKYLFTLSLEKASQNKLINQINVLESHKHKEEILKLIYHAYCKASEYDRVYPLIHEIINNNESNLSRFTEAGLRRIAEFLDLDTSFLCASQIENDGSLKGRDKIMAICKRLNADEYINPIGGTELYDKDEFLRKGIRLSFLKTKDIVYPQFKNDFVPNLSIIDVLMFNPKAKIKDFLNDFELV